jgi:hypothetical protein
MGTYVTAIRQQGMALPDHLHLNAESDSKLAAIPAPMVRWLASDANASPRLSRLQTQNGSRGLRCLEPLSLMPDWGWGLKIGRVQHALDSWPNLSDRMA